MPKTTRVVNEGRLHADAAATGGDGKETEAVRARLKGISFVSGKELQIKQLLNGFWPTDNVAEDIKRIEMVAPFIRPYGCGPVAPADWLVLRTYMNILELRDKTRMDDNGLNIGDRTFKRCYQTAMEEMASTSGTMSSTKRAEIIQTAFRPVVDKLWHRYLFPFGTFAFKTNATGSSKSEVDFRNELSNKKPGSATVMNKYSVAAADILYMCNTGGYLERYIYIIGVIMWAKRHGYNLLHHRHSTKSINKLDEFYSLEKHLYVFGSIMLHLWVMESNKLDVGGNWGEMLQVLQHLLTDAISDFGIDKNLFESRVKDLTIRAVVGSLNPISVHFKKATRVEDNR